MEKPKESQNILQEAQQALKRAEQTFIYWKQQATLLEDQRDEAVTLAASAQGNIQAYQWIVERLESFKDGK